MNLKTGILSGDKIPNCTVLNQQIFSSFGVKCNGPDEACGLDLTLNDAITTGNFLMPTFPGDMQPHSF